jgi:hypothetical protein
MKLFSLLIVVIAVLTHKAQANSPRFVLLDPFSQKTELLIEKAEAQENMKNCLEILTTKMNAVVRLKSSSELGSDVNAEGFPYGINVFSVYRESSTAKIYYLLTSGPIAVEDGYIPNSGYYALVGLTEKSCDVVEEGLSWGSQKVRRDLPLKKGK